MPPEVLLMMKLLVEEEERLVQLQVLASWAAHHFLSKNPFHWPSAVATHGRS